MRSSLMALLCAALVLVTPVTASAAERTVTQDTVSGTVKTTHRGAAGCPVGACTVAGSLTLGNDASLCYCTTGAAWVPLTSASYSKLTAVVGLAATTVQAAVVELLGFVQAAQSDATQALADAATALGAAGAAQADATQALADAATAQGAAGAAQGDATQALADAATAQGTANAAAVAADLASTATGEGASTIGLEAVAGLVAATVQTAVAELTGLVQAAQTAAGNAQADATQALADAATAQGVADAAIPASLADADGDWLRASGADAWAKRTTAQARVDLGIDGITKALGFDGVYLSGGVTTDEVANTVCDGTSCYSRVTLKGAASSIAGCRAVHVPAWAGAWNGTTATSIDYRVGAVGTPLAYLMVFDAVTDATPCYTSGSGNSTTFATLSASAANLTGAGCSLTAGAVVLVCLDCAGDTDETCDARIIAHDVD